MNDGLLFLLFSYFAVSHGRSGSLSTLLQSGHVAARLIALIVTDNPRQSAVRLYASLSTVLEVSLFAVAAAGTQGQTFVIRAAMSVGFII